MKVTASTTKVGADGKKVKDQSVDAEVNIPETLAELVSEFGESVVVSAAVDAIIISAQAQMRRLMLPTRNKEGKETRAAQSAEHIQAHMSQWKPDAKSVTRQSTFEKVSTGISKLTPEERKALLEKLQAAV